MKIFQTTVWEEFYQADYIILVFTYVASKKVLISTKTPLMYKKAKMKKMWNQIGWPRPPAVKIFNNNDKAAKHSECFAAFRMFCSLVIIIKLQFHRQQEALAAQFDFASFSSWPFLVLGLYFLYTGGVLLD